MLEDFKESKAKYFVIALIILIALGVVLIVHFNNKTLVNGKDKEEEITEKTTTKKVKEKKKKTTTTTTKKVETKEEVKQDVVAAVTEETVYKSTVDKNTEFVYNYKLTDEILDTDKIISKALDIPSNLYNKNVIRLFDISLYSNEDVKKAVNNSLITVRVPIDDYLKQYDEYKVVYVNDNYEATDETFNTIVNDNYIEFETTHLSMYGIIGTKKIVNKPVNNPVEEEIDMSNIKLELYKRIAPYDELVEEKIEGNNSYLVAKSDLMRYEITLDGNFDVEYLLTNENYNSGYLAFDSAMFESVPTPGVYKLNIKVTVNKNGKTNSRIFEMGTFKVYDIVYQYDKNAPLTENVNIGYDDELPDYTYDDVEKNENIAIDNITSETVVASEDDVAINLYGNIYLVEETDITKLKMTGYLTIDTNENITSLPTNFDNIKTITIKSKEFMLNGQKYTYDYSNATLTIKKVELNENNEEVFTDITENSNELVGVFGDNRVADAVNGELIIKLRDLIENPVEPTEPENDSETEEATNNVGENIELEEQ